MKRLVTLPTDQEVYNLALLKLVCQRSLRDHWRNHGWVEVKVERRFACLQRSLAWTSIMPVGDFSILLGRRTIVLIKLSCISLLAKLEKGLHLLLYKISAALFAQVDLILIDDHDPHTFPLFPTGFADLGLDLGFKLSHEEGICNRFSGLATCNALDVCHGVSILSQKL
jgi:hypothetical protein